MQQTKLIDTLRHLDTRERTRWRQYVHSGFFNKHAALRQLADYILHYAPDFTQEALKKKQVYLHLFGEQEPYNELKINNLISDLYELLLGYLACVHWENEPLDQYLHTANALLDRGLTHQASAVLARTRTLLDRQANRTAAHQQLELRWWEARENLDSREARRIAGEHLHRQATAIDTAFVLEKLRLGAAQLSRQGLAVVQSDERPRWLNAIRQWCSDEPFLAELPAVQAYLAALDLLEHPAPESFATLTAILDTNHAVFGKDELAALYQYALNYCIRRINDGHPEAYPEALHLYRVLLDREVLLRQGNLSQWTYKNITTAGLRSGAFEWTEHFLNQYRAALPAAERDNAYAYNLAALFFEKEDFANALITLQNVEFTDFTYHLGAKILQLKCFFLLQEYEALLPLLEATQQLLRRNRSLSVFGKNANLNFLRMLRQIVAWKGKEPFISAEARQTQRRNLEEKVRLLQPLANKDWLLEVLTAP